MEEVENVKALPDTNKISAEELGQDLKEEKSDNIIVKGPQKTKFGGKVGATIDNPKTGKKGDFVTASERAFEQKHLHNFLQGATDFTHGKDDEGRPARHKVKRVL